MQNEENFDQCNRKGYNVKKKMQITLIWSNQYASGILI